MKNLNSSPKTETRIGQAVRPFPAFVSGIIAGSIITVYGTLTNVNLFKYIGSNSRDIITFYKDLLGISKTYIPSNSGIKGYFDKLNIRVDQTDFQITALPNSICDQMVREGDRIQVQGGSESSSENSQFHSIEEKIKTIVEEGTGTLEIKSIEEETVVLDIDLLSDEPSCIRKTPKIKQLETLLQDKKWQSADAKTYEVLLDIADRETEGNLDRNAIKNLNCPDLKIVDDLWFKNSGSRFGFEIQQEIYTETGNSLDENFIKKYDPNLYIQFSDLVRWVQTQEDNKESWKSNDQLLYTLEAAKGHLPRLKQLEDGMETEPGYQLISPNSLEVSSQEIEARNLFYARVEACNL